MGALSGAGLISLALQADQLWHVNGLSMALATAKSDPFLWYVTRATGVASYVTLSISVALGILQSIARTSRERLPWLVDELHQFIATLTGALIVGHLVALKFDPFLPFSLANMFIPIHEPYSPLGVTAGVFALYCMIALLSSSWLRRRTPYTFWRGIHYFSFLAFALVTAHGMIAGSDAHEPWMFGLYVGASCGVAFLTLLRLFSGSPSPAKA